MCCHDTVTFPRQSFIPDAQVHAQHDAAVLSRLTYRTELERAPSGLVLRSDAFLELEGGSFPKEKCVWLSDRCGAQVSIRWDPGRAAAQTDCAAEAADRGGVVSFLAT